jgi:hypothetical protein
MPWETAAARRVNSVTTTCLIVTNSAKAIVISGIPTKMSFLKPPIKVLASNQGKPLLWSVGIIL